MNISKKREEHRKNGIKFFYPHFTDDDIKYFSPENYRTLDDAIQSAIRLMTRTAHINGFYKRDILISGMEDVKNRITEFYTKELFKNEDQ